MASYSYNLINGDQVIFIGNFTIIYNNYIIDLQN